jgi:phage terminase large subunit-like protein
VLEEILREMRDFREDEQHETDDFVDAASDATNKLLGIAGGYNFDLI